MQHRNWIFLTCILLYFSCDLSAQLPTHHFIKVDSKKVIPAQKYDYNKTSLPHKSPRLLPSLPPSVFPLLPDQWDQYAPNNWMTPIVDGEHCVVGCIATAMSQVMHYWKYPERGMGSITYDDSLGCKQILSADFSKSQYDWTNMLDKYEIGKYSDVQGNAVALLSRDCGYSVKMRYTNDASAASAINQAIALTNYFGYDESTLFHFRDFYSRDEITSMLKKELAEGRPVLISAYNTGGGHAFVIDGYDENDWFHMNLGNPAGPDNGDCFTPLDCMSPDQPRWGHYPDCHEGGLNLLQIFTFTRPRTAEGAIHIEPRLYAMQRMDVVDTVAEKGREVRVCVRDLSNMAKVQQTDTVSLFLMRNGERLHTLYTYNRDFLLEEVDDTTYTDTLSLPLPSDLPDGEYSLLPMFREGGAWKEVRTCVGTPNYLLMNVSGSNISVCQDSANYAYVTLEDFEIPDLLLNASAPKISITLKAHNHEISGRFNILMEPLDEDKKPFYLWREGFSLLKDEVSRRELSYTKVWVPATGRYRVHFLYDNNLFSDELIELTDQTIEVTYSHTGVFLIAKI